MFRGVERQRRAMAGEMAASFVVIDVDRDDLGAEGLAICTQ